MWCRMFIFSVLCWLQCIHPSCECGDSYYHRLCAPFFSIIHSTFAAKHFHIQQITLFVYLDHKMSRSSGSNNNKQSKTRNKAINFDGNFGFFSSFFIILQHWEKWTQTNIAKHKKEINRWKKTIKLRRREKKWRKNSANKSIGIT